MLSRGLDELGYVPIAAHKTIGSRCDTSMPRYPTNASMVLIYGASA